jgi:hypothetical protein
MQILNIKQMTNMIIEFAILLFTLKIRVEEKISVQHTCKILHLLFMFLK